MGDVEEEVLHGRNAKALKGFGALLADPFQELHWSVEAKLGHEGRYL